MLIAAKDKLLIDSGGWENVVKERLKFISDLMIYCVQYLDSSFT